MLKEKTIELLRKQKDEKYSFENVDILELANELLENIGDHDSEIRDGLIYSSLAHIIHDKHLDNEQLLDFLNKLLSDDYLFYDIEQDSLNSVLKRSFSSLQIVILLYVHKRDDIFNEEIIKSALVRYLDYFESEKHYEGYNEQVGWLHSIAHSADVFNQFLTIDCIKETEIKLIFEAIQLKMKQRHHYFSFDEDERMIIGMTKAIKRDLLTKEYLLDYIERFSHYTKNSNYPEMYYITKNTRNMLRALYFALIDDDNYSYLNEEIKRVLEENVTLR